MTAAYPFHLRTILQASKSRSQPAAFSMSEPRRGFAYVEQSGTDTPIYWDCTFAFTQIEAQSFRLWFNYTIRRGVDEFTMPIRTEFGVVEHLCRFAPDNLLDLRESGSVYTYRATIMTREEVIPEDIVEAAELIAGIPAWPTWASLLDSAITAEMPV